MPEGQIVKGYIMPGMPHVMLPTESASRSELRNACRVAGANAQEARPDVLIVFSTQWVSVLGHLVQARANPTGLHVDENWYDLGNLPYNFRTDLEVARRTIDLGTAAGLQVRPVDYEGFPVDTGTLVALNFLNPKSEIPVVCISCNIYSGREEELKLGQATADAVRALDGAPWWSRRPDSRVITSRVRLPTRKTGSSTKRTTPLTASCST